MHLNTRVGQVRKQKDVKKKKKREKLHDSNIPTTPSYQLPFIQ